MVTTLSLEGGDVGALTGVILRAVWAEDKDIGDGATLEALEDGCGLDGAGLIAASEADEVQDTYDSNTEAAIEMEVFGAPTYVFDGELFWGQDRLGF